VHAGESFLSSKLSIAGQIASGEQVAIETDLGRLDIVQGMKRAAGRTRDLADLEDLDAASK
jgi:hypothetical protein